LNRSLAAPSQNRVETYDEEFAMIAAAKPQEAESEDGAHDQPGLRPMLNERQVLRLVPISRTSLYRLERAGKFPRSTYVSPNRKLWFRDEIIAWQAAVDERDPARRRGKGRRPRGSRGA
jgi:predicted DNA-binding transcriptional regulator AlpA